MSGRFLRAAYSIVALLLGVGSGTAWAQPVPGENEIFVANLGNLEGLGQGITVYARTASDNATPLRTFGRSYVVGPAGLAVDRANREVFVLSSGSISWLWEYGSVQVYDLLADGDVDVPPLRTIAGPTAGLRGPWGLALDTIHNELVVANGELTTGELASVKVFARTANGDVAALRTIAGAATGLSRPVGPAVDTVNEKLVVANYDINSITVYARTADGNAAPLRTIAGTATGLKGPLGLAVDTVNNELVVANSGNNSITVYNLITVYDVTAPGSVTPTRTITGLNFPAAVAVDTVNDEIAVAGFFNPGSVSVYDRRFGGLLRTIEGPDTGLYAPMALAITTDCPSIITLSPATLPNGTSGLAYTTTLTPTFGTSPYTFTVSGLPAGMTPTSPVTGPSVTIAGTPAASFLGTVRVRGTDSNNCPFSQDYSLTIDPSGGSPATITSANTATFTVGTYGSFQVTTAGIPAPQLFNNSRLPLGLSFVDNGDGTATLDGTPIADAAGVYPLTLLANNGLGSDIQNFVLTVEIPYATSFTGQTPDGLEATAALSGGGPNCVFSQAAFIPESGDPRSPPTAPPSGVAFPKGLFNFAAAGCLGSVTITITYPSALPYGTIYEKYGPQPGPIAADWYQLSTAVISGNTVTLTISDGGLGDNDLAVNGSIVDPGGPASPPGTAPAFTNGPPLASATVGTPYSFTYTASGTTPITFSVTAGALPTGLSLSATGDISGAPTTVGNFTGIVTASNGTPPDATQDFSIAVADASVAPTIMSANAATFTVGSLGTFTLTATGSPVPTLSESGALPSGVTFNTSTGVLSGTPAAGTAGAYNLVFTADNGVAPNATQNFTLTVNQAPAITSANSATFTVGSLGTFTLTATGSPAPALSESGALPSGVTFNASTGVLSGTLAAGTAGTYNLVFTAANGVAPNATQNFTLTVNQAPAITSGNAATFTIGAPGSFTVTATGSPAPTLSESGALPSGVTFNASTGVLSGTPAAGTAGTYNLVFTAANGVAPNATQNFTLTVNQAPAATHFSVVAPASATAGSAFSLTVRALDASNNTMMGYTGTVHFTSTDAQAVLPSNYTFLAGDAGVKSFSVTLKTAGSRTVTATDTSTSITGTATVGVSAGSPASITATAGTPQSAAINTAFATNLAATVRDSSNNLVGGVVVTFTAPSSGASGTFAGGLTMTNATTNANGVATASVFTANGTTGSYTVAAAFSAAASPASFSLTNTSCAAVSISPSELPGATMGEAYRQTLTASGGTAPYRFSVTDGSLPSGLGLSGEGVISGRPAAAGSFRFTVTAVGANGCRGSRSYTLVVSCAAITINPPTLHAAKVGKTYSRILKAVGGAGSVTFAVSEGSLPPGLQLSAGTPGEAEHGEDEGSHARLSGVPTQPGSFAFTITATDYKGCTGSRSYTLVVISPKGNGKIAFSKSPEPGIFAINPNGHGETRITKDGIDPAWSPNGKVLAYVRSIDSINAVWIKNLEESETRQVTSGPADFDPAWSPDGKKIAFVRDTSGYYGAFDIFVVNADGTGLTRLTSGPESYTYNFHPSWSPDGSHIAFWSDRTHEGTAIFVMNADGSQPTRLTFGKEADSDPDWSPEGTQIVFTSNRNDPKRGQIYVMNADGSGQTRLTSNRAFDGEAKWAPDGTQIVFTSNRDGKLRLYVMNSDGTSQRAISISDGANRMRPVWQPLPERE